MVFSLVNSIQDAIHGLWIYGEKDRQRMSVSLSDFHELALIDQEPPAPKAKEEPSSDIVSMLKNAKIAAQNTPTKASTTTPSKAKKSSKGFDASSRPSTPPRDSEIEKVNIAAPNSEVAPASFVQPVFPMPMQPPPFYPTGTPNFVPVPMNIPVIPTVTDRQKGNEILAALGIHRPTPATDDLHFAMRDLAEIFQAVESMGPMSQTLSIYEFHSRLNALVQVRFFNFVNRLESHFY
jgi:hypothetical protein